MSKRGKKRRRREGGEKTNINSNISDFTIYSNCHVSAAAAASADQNTVTQGAGSAQCTVHSAVTASDLQLLLLDETMNPTALDGGGNISEKSNSGSVSSLSALLGIMTEHWRLLEKK